MGTDAYPQPPITNLIPQPIIKSIIRPVIKLVI